MLKIAFDIDGVLSDSFPVLREEIINKCGIDVGENEPRTFLLEKILPIDKEQIFECVKSYIKRWKDINPVHGSIEFLNWYMTFTGEPVRMITSRKLIFKEYTINWIERFFGRNEYELYFSNKENPKWKIMEEIDASILVEDRLKYAIDASENGKTVFLLKKPYNTDFSRMKSSLIIPLEDWNDLKRSYCHMCDLFEKVTEELVNIISEDLKDELD